MILCRWFSCFYKRKTSGIIGIGVDTVNISRIEHMIAKHGDRFLARLFTPEEIAGAEKFPVGNNRAKAAYFAKRFAAKEAATKALGTGFRQGVSFQDFSIRNDNEGKPLLQITGNAQAVLKKISAKTHAPFVHVSLSDDYPSAIAVVIFSY